MKRITTVCGDIEPTMLGVTTMHEHTLLDMKAFMKAFKSGNPKPGEDDNAQVSISAIMKMMRTSPAFKMKSFDYYLGELEEFKNVGGRSLVDCTPHGGQVDMKKIQKLSLLSGVNIIACTGLYLAPTIPGKLAKGGEALMMSLFDNEVTNGIKKTNVKPGFIKCALGTLDNGMVCDLELTSLRACCKIAKKHGLLIQVHTAYPLSNEHILDAVSIMLDEIGVDPQRVLMCHIDSGSMQMLNPKIPVNSKGINTDLALALLGRKVNISLDSWGFLMVGDASVQKQDETRFMLLKELIDRGYEDYIVLGHDVINKFLGKQAGKFGYTRFSTFIPAMLEKFGYSQESYEKLTIYNPARILAY